MLHGYASPSLCVIHSRLFLVCFLLSPFCFSLLPPPSLSLCVCLCSRLPRLLHSLFMVAVLLHTSCALRLAFPSFPLPPFQVSSPCHSLLHVSLLGARYRRSPSSATHPHTKINSTHLLLPQLLPHFLPPSRTLPLGWARREVASCRAGDLYRRRK